VGSQRHIPAALPPRKETQYPLYCRKSHPHRNSIPGLIHKGTVKDFQRTHTVRDAVFDVTSAWNSVKTKTLRQAWRKLWPAVMIAKKALDEEGFMGFHVHNRGTVHEKVLMSEKLDFSNPECEVSQVDVAECINAAKRDCSVTYHS